MPLDSQINPADKAQHPAEEPGALEQFRQSFLYETQQQLTGIVQLGNTKAKVDLVDKPEPADSFIGQNIQMVAAATADLLPMLATTLAARHSLGLTLQGPVPKMALSGRSGLALKVSETTAAGFVSGMILQPTEDAENMSLGKLTARRIYSGLHTALSFTTLTGTSSLLHGFGARSASTLARDILTNPLGNSIVSGIPGGFLSTEIDSMLGHFDVEADPSVIGKNIYGMSMLGGFFGATMKGFSTLERAHVDNRLNAVFGEPTADKVRSLESDGLDARALTSFVKESPERRQWVSDLVENGATVKQLDLSRLSALEYFHLLYGKDSPAVAGLLGAEAEGLKLGDLRAFVDSGNNSMAGFVMPNQRAQQLNAMLAVGASAKELAPERIASLKALTSSLGENNPTLITLLALEKQGAELNEAARFLGWTFAQGEAQAFLAKVAEEGQPKKISADYLSARQDVEQRLGKSSESVAQFLKRENLSTANMEALAHFLAFSPEHVPTIKRLIDEGAGWSRVTPSRLRALSSLENMYGADSPTVKRLLELEGNRLQLNDVASFALENANNKELIKQLVEQDNGSGRLNTQQLRDRDNLPKLNKYFPPGSPEAAYISNLQEHSLSAARLARYIDEAPESRLPLISKLIGEKADLARFNTQMSLSVFPDQVANTLIESGSSGAVRLPQVISNLRDWQAGRQFRDLVIDHIESGKPLSAQSLDQLMETARANPGDERLKLSRGDRKQATQGDFDTASALEKSADHIDRLIPQDKPLVLLGRDAWPLLPLLRARGRDVQYFLWSRLQINDRQTAQQWLKEVPPHAAVVDTGYSGRILEAINRVDPTSQGYLLSSSMSKYPQLLGWGSHGQVVKIEAVPKLIGRSSTYSQEGNAISRQQSRDDTDVARVSRGTKFESQDRWEMQAATRSLLTLTGLPQWDVWRFQEYVGLTARERLFVNDDTAVQKHYAKVAQQRKEAELPTWQRTQAK